MTPRALSYALLTGSILGTPAAAWSQTADSAAAPVTGQAAVSEATTPEAPDTKLAAEDSAQEIVVTAQRRSEKLRDVPISITVLDEKLMSSAGIQNTHDLERLTPALQMQSYGGWLQPSVRGISSTGASPGDSSNVAIYLDGVYQVNQATQLFDLPDVTQVEVLKGPQGALYGQNAAGGAIIIQTREPTFDLSGEFYAGYGSYDDRTIGGYISGPISDKIAASLTATYQNRDGFRRDIINGGHDSGLKSSTLRGKLLFKPSDTVSVTVIGHYSKRSDSGLFSGSPLHGNSVGYAINPDAPQPSPHETATSDVGSKFKTYGASVRGDFDTGSGTINTITAYNRAEVRQFADVDYSQANVAVTNPDPAQSSFIQEINYIADKRGRFAWSVGLFYLSSEDSYQGHGVFTAYSGATSAPDDPGPALLVAPFNGSLHKQAGAVYAEGSYDILDNLTLTLGARYSYERQRGFAAFTADGSRPPRSEFPDGRQVFKKFTPHANLVFKPNSSSTLYANYGRGFKSGLINILDFSGPAVKPENVTGYELGYKAQPLQWASFEISAFRYDYRDLQVSSYVAPNYVYENGAAARINGIEFSGEVRPAKGLSISGGLSYLDAKYVRYKGDPVVLTIFIPNGVGGNNQAALDVTGKPLIRAPEFVGNLSARYTTETSAGTFGAFASMLYNDGFSQEASNRIRQPSYTTIDGELSLAPTFLPGARVSLWGKNLTNKTYQQSVLVSVLADGVSYAPPRTYGVKLEYSF